MEPDCVYCGKEVRPRQQALNCDNCNRWQHRVCATSITQKEYRLIVKGELDLGEWFCFKCPAPPRPNLSSALVDDECSRRQSGIPQEANTTFDDSLPIQIGRRSETPSEDGHPNPGPQLNVTYTVHIPSVEHTTDIHECVESIDPADLEQEQPPVEGATGKQDRDQTQQAEPGHEPTPDRLSPDGPVTYKILVGGRVKGGDLLTDTHG